MSVEYVVTLSCGCIVHSETPSEIGEDWCCHLHGDEEGTAECRPIHNDGSGSPS